MKLQGTDRRHVTLDMRRSSISRLAENPSASPETNHRLRLTGEQFSRGDTYARIGRLALQTCDDWLALDA